MRDVDLRKLKPNPLRDQRVDPIDPGKVEELRKSILEDGFWGGIVCRETPDGIEIGAGHHRVQAAIAAGVTTADVHVRELNDADMVRVYARENATQRGEHATAQCGSVAAAVRLLARGLLTTGCLLNSTDTPHSLDILRGQLASDKGLGRDAVVKALDGVPGITPSAVQQQLANLKSSGAYARIIDEVAGAIEARNRAAVKAAEKAERERAAAEKRRKQAEAERDATKEQAKRKRAAGVAKAAEQDERRARAEAAKHAAAKKEAEAARSAAEAAKKHERTFDFEGVAQHLKNPHQVDVFRTCVTGPALREALPVDNQEALAEQLVKTADEQGRELTGAFIRQEISGLVLGARSDARHADNLRKEHLRQQDAQFRAQEAIDGFVRSVGAVKAAGYRLTDILAKWPNGCPYPRLTQTFRDAIKSAAEVVNQLAVAVDGVDRSQKARGLLKAGE